MNRSKHCNWPPHEDDDWDDYEDEFDVEAFVEEEEEEEEYGEESTDGWYNDHERMASLGPYLEYWEAERSSASFDD